MQETALMANLNKVMVIGRLTRDPEMVTFANGGRVAKFGFAVNNRRKNQSTGQWEDEPVFLDVEAYNRDTGRKLADLVEQYLKKGHQAYLECSMKLDTWNDKTSGEKRQKLKFVLNDVQFLEPKAAGGNAEEGAPRMARGGSPPVRPGSAPARSNGPAYDEEEPEPMDPPAGRGGQEEDIPF
jgi:single-strand DNA-binding protein